MVDPGTPPPSCVDNRHSACPIPTANRASGGKQPHQADDSRHDQHHGSLGLGGARPSGDEGRAGVAADRCIAEQPAPRRIRLGKCSRARERQHLEQECRTDCAEGYAIQCNQDSLSEEEWGMR